MLKYIIRMLTKWVFLVWIGAVLLLSSCSTENVETNYKLLQSIELLSTNNDSLIIQKIKNDAIQELNSVVSHNYETPNHKWFVINSFHSINTTHNNLLALYGGVKEAQLHFYNSQGVYRTMQIGNSPLSYQQTYNFTSPAFGLKDIDFSKPILLRLEKSTVQEIVVVDSRFYFKNEINRLAIAGFVVGILIFLFVFNLYFYFISKNVNQLIYSLIVLFFVNNSLYALAIPGINLRPEFIFGSISFEKFRLHTIDALINGLLVLIYCLSFLSFPKKNTILSKIVYTMMSAQGLLLLTILLVRLDNSWMRFIIDYWMPSIIMLTLFCGIYDYYKGNKLALYYVLGYLLFTLFVIGDSILQLKGTGYPYNVPMPLLLVGFLSEAILLNIGLLRRIEFDKQKAQQDKIGLIENQNETLEKMVNERTFELLEKQDEILAQNEELAQMAEQLALQRDEIVKQKETIEFQNISLEQSNYDLEKKIRERTLEIQKVNEAIVSQNSKLEQFTFMTAHNIRGPIARLLGLTTIFNDHDLTDTVNAEVITKVKESAHDLDSIVREISNVLEIQKGGEEPLQWVFVRPVIDKVLKKLKDEIQRENAHIDIQVDYSFTLACVEAYLYSILYNTLANSIKYKKAAQKLTITIAVLTADDCTILVIRDNGMGLDLEKYADKIFKPFTRFNTDKDGRGLGMYLSKIQMEAMGGQVQIKSQLEEGLTTLLKFYKTV